MLLSEVALLDLALSLAGFSHPDRALPGRAAPEVKQSRRRQCPDARLTLWLRKAPRRREEGYRVQAVKLSGSTPATKSICLPLGQLKL